MTNPRDILSAGISIINERGLSYGGIEENFSLIADMARLRLGRDIHPYEIAVIMCCVKMARLFSNPAHLDSRIDAINYEAFAAMFAADYAAQFVRKPEAEANVEEDMADIVASLAPRKAAE